MILCKDLLDALHWVFEQQTHDLYRHQPSQVFERQEGAICTSRQPSQVFEQQTHDLYRHQHSQVFEQQTHDLYRHQPSQLFERQDARSVPAASLLRCLSAKGAIYTSLGRSPRKLGDPKDKG